MDGSQTLTVTKGWIPGFRTRTTVALPATPTPVIPRRQPEPPPQALVPSRVTPLPPWLPNTVEGFFRALFSTQQSTLSALLSLSPDNAQTVEVPLLAKLGGALTVLSNLELILFANGGSLLIVNFPVFNGLEAVLNLLISSPRIRHRIQQHCKAQIDPNAPPSKLQIQKDRIMMGVGNFPDWFLRRAEKSEQDTSSTEAVEDGGVGSLIIGWALWPATTVYKRTVGEATNRIKGAAKEKANSLAVRLAEIFLEHTLHQARLVGTGLLGATVGALTKYSPRKWLVETLWVISPEISKKRGDFDWVNFSLLLIPQLAWGLLSFGTDWSLLTQLGIGITVQVGGVVGGAGYRMIWASIQDAENRAAREAGKPEPHTLPFMAGSTWDEVMQQDLSPAAQAYKGFKGCLRWVGRKVIMPASKSAYSVISEALNPPKEYFDSICGCGPWEPEITDPNERALRDAGVRDR